MSTRFVGIDIGLQTHVVAIVDEAGQVLVKPTPFREDATGYEKLLGLLGSPEATLIAFEATGHYGRNLFATLAEKSFAVALLNPLRTRRFAEEDLARAKTDSIDALGIARFAAQKRPRLASPPDDATGALRELVRFQDRLTQDFGDRLRQLHRVVDLGFPEFTTHVRTLDSYLATTILHEYPTAKAFKRCSVSRLARLVYDGHHRVGPARARALIESASASVGRHHGPVYEAQARYLCKDIDTLRRQVRQLRSEIAEAVRVHPVGSLLLTIDVLGDHAVAHVIAAVGDPARFTSAAAFASYAGVVPGVKQSGLHRPTHSPLCPLGNARLRKALWMPTLTAVRTDPWLSAYYQRLRAAGKKPKVALVAVMRKLLTAVYSVAKHRRPFVRACAAVQNTSDHGRERA